MLRDETKTRPCPTALLKAMVDVYGHASVAEAARAVLTTRPGRPHKRPWEDTARWVRANMRQDADPSLTRWAAVMGVLDEEGVWDQAERKLAFMRVSKIDRRHRHLPELAVTIASLDRIRT